MFLSRPLRWVGRCSVIAALLWSAIGCAERKRQAEGVSPIWSAEAMGGAERPPALDVRPAQETDRGLALSLDYAASDHKATAVQFALNFDARRMEIRDLRLTELQLARGKRLDWYAESSGQVMVLVHGEGAQELAEGPLVELSLEGREARPISEDISIRWLGAVDAEARAISVRGLDG